MVLVDDLIIGFSAAVTTATLVVLGVLLSRYRTLTRDATKASQLAKDVYDSMNSRFATQDGRIVDLMARFEVYSTYNKANLGVTSVRREPEPQDTSRISQQNLTSSQPSAQVSPPSAPQPQSEKMTNETKITILKALIEGPKTSNQVREVIQVTREHNGRLLKELFDHGLVLRNTANKPFVYEITDSGRRFAGA